MVRLAPAPDPRPARRIPALARSTTRVVVRNRIYRLDEEQDQNDITSVRQLNAERRRPPQSTFIW